LRDVLARRLGPFRRVSRDVAARMSPDRDALSRRRLFHELHGHGAAEARPLAPPCASRGVAAALNCYREPAGVALVNRRCERALGDVVGVLGCGRASLRVHRRSFTFRRVTVEARHNTRALAAFGDAPRRGLLGVPRRLGSRRPPRSSRASRARRQWGGTVPVLGARGVRTLRFFGLHESRWSCLQLFSAAAQSTGAPGSWFRVVHLDQSRRSCRALGAHRRSCDVPGAR